MEMVIRRGYIGILLALYSLFMIVPARAEVSEAEFERLHAELQRPEGEPWRSIPWMIDLLDAQSVAAEAKKPLFLWSMDGHPLGCT